MAHRAAVNQLVQLGPETTPGTAVAAAKLIEAFTWTWGIKPSIKLFRPTGRKYSSTAEELTEMTEGKISGDMDYNAAAYVLMSLFGAGTPLAAPAAPTISNAGAGGTVATGTYQAKVTYVDANGETVASASASTTTTDGTSTITINSPAALTGATGWYAYVTQAGGNTYTRQQALGSPTTIGANLTLTAPPTSTGANPPTVNTSGTTPKQHAPSAIAYDWQFTPPLSGAANPQTYTYQQGDSVRAEQMAYLLFSGWGYKIDRKSPVTISGDFMGQLITDPATMTPNPTIVPLLPMVGKQTNIYLDTTSAGIGTTQLTAFVSFEFAASGYYGPLWFLNRANPSWSAHVDLAPKNEVKLQMEADSQGMSLLAHMQAGDTVYVRVDALGPVIDAPNAINAEMKHDMALKVSNVSEFSDKDGLYAIEWTLEVVEDSSWGASGTAQTLTLTNTLSAL